MNVVGLVVEYNPLHNGHLYHFQQAKKASGSDATVAVMSGNFLQRGEPAVVDKRARAEMALSIGIDLVIELPTAYCTQNAEMFAFGAISTLHSFGVVDCVCFGSESGDIHWIDLLAERLIDEPADFKKRLRGLLDKGLPYPRAYAAAASALVGVPPELLEQPNNILGLNYVLALKRLGSRIQPVTIQRIKAGYHQEDISDVSIASATAIRKRIFEQSDVQDIAPFVPNSTATIISREKNNDRFPVSWNQFFPFVLHSLLTKKPEELGQIHEMGEGIENRLQKFAMLYSSYDLFMENLKTKRYTWNRLQRLLLYLLLNLKKSEMQSFSLSEGVPYIRVLGFNEKGKQLIKKAKEVCPLPIITKIPRDPHPMLALDIRATSVYELGLRGGRARAEYEYVPVIK
ncbi:nucleotidyltransferase [Ammoniphilus resinae]|uniref:tRNA(Met) cytidine acetate ligase n=1 Tax=Ammoniphilus resinae TaxID=861532 RepID=A0ABS4GKH4_9BACL|nr:nucleotidyltransferase [Ammoniphilus resinae]MBP1930744.1 putative nucleotidyltransferase [Ammoniphilus resinae]